MGEAVGVVGGVLFELRFASTRVAAGQVCVACHVDVCARLILTANSRRLAALVDVTTIMSVSLQRHKTVWTLAGVIVVHRIVHSAEFGELAEIVCSSARVIIYNL